MLASLTGLPPSVVVQQVGIGEPLARRYDRALPLASSDHVEMFLCKAARAPSARFSFLCATRVCPVIAYRRVTRRISFIPAWRDGSTPPTRAAVSPHYLLRRAGSFHTAVRSAASLPAYRPLFGKRIKIAVCAARRFSPSIPPTAARSFFTRSRIRLRNAKRALRSNGLRLV